MSVFLFSLETNLLLFALKNLLAEPTLWLISSSPLPFICIQTEIFEYIHLFYFCILYVYAVSLLLGICNHRFCFLFPSRYSPLCEDDVEDSWEWWNDFRRYCHYDKRLGLVLEMPDVKHVPTLGELERWVGEPVKAISIDTTLFLTNQHKQPVLSKVHQDIIMMFLSLDVQYIIKGAKLHCHNYRQYCAYINFLGKKLFKSDAVSDFVHG